MRSEYIDAVVVRRGLLIFDNADDPISHSDVGGYALGLFGEGGGGDRRLR